MGTDDSQTSIIRISFEAKAAGRICRITSTISYCIRRRRERERDGEAAGNDEAVIITVHHMLLIGIWKNLKDKWILDAFSIQ
jgi:hypothetical protein